MTDLSDYIQNLLNQGYSEDYIKKYLEQYGYDKTSINQAFNNVNPPRRNAQTVRHEHHVSKSAIIFLILFLVIGSGVVLGVLKLTGVIGSEALLDYEVTPKQSKIQAGTELPFTLKIINLGDKQRFDVTVNHKVKKGTQAITTREETFAVSTSVTRDKTIPAPTETGRHTFTSKATYQGKTATSSFSFYVQPTQEEQQQEEEEEKEQKEEQGRQEKTVMEEVKETAGTQPSQAEQLCQQLNGTARDDCLLLIVQESQRPEFCDPVQDVEARDNCYMNFIIDGKAHLCSKVQLESNQNYCDRMKDLQIMSQTK